MRQATLGLGTPDHAGLAYEVYAGPDVVARDASRAERLRTARDTWLNGVAASKWPSDYTEAYGAWEATLGGKQTLCIRGTLTGRLLVGHGNPSPTEVGLSLHRTWGVPVIPGSALKGLLSHWTQHQYGWADQDEGPQWKGPRWDGNRVMAGPGDIYRFLFGTGKAEDGSLAQAGCVTFHDALSVPAAEPFLCRDVLTVHQQPYYGGTSWPTDHADPIPVPFLTVRPGVSFLFALTAPTAWHPLLARLLGEALSEWGVGGKTSAGYGRVLLEGYAQGDPAQPGGDSAPGGEERDEPAQPHRSSPESSPSRAEAAWPVRFLDAADLEGRWRVLFQWANDEGIVADWARVFIKPVQADQPVAKWLHDLVAGQARHVASQLPLDAIDGESHTIAAYMSAFRAVLIQDGYIGAWVKRNTKGPRVKTGGDKLRERGIKVQEWSGE